MYEKENVQNPVAPTSRCRNTAMWILVNYARKKALPSNGELLEQEYWERNQLLLPFKPRRQRAYCTPEGTISLLLA